MKFRKIWNWRTFMLIGWVVVRGTTMGICQPPSLASLYNQSVTAYKEKDYDEFERLNIEALQLHPSHPTILYNLAAAYSLNNKLESSFNTLAELISWKADVKFEVDPDFTSLLNNLTYKEELQKKKDEFSTEKVESKVMATIDKDYHLEDVLYLDNKLIVTDVKNGYVLSYDIESNKTTRVAILSGAAFALTSAAEKNCFWVSSAVVKNYKNFDEKNENNATLVKIDIEKNKIIATIDIPNKAIIGSMIRIGNKIYATNSLNPEILVVDTKLNQVIKSIAVDGAVSLQGITQSENEKYAFVADYIVGIVKINLENGKPDAWLISEDYLLKGIDGITYINPNTLIAIQNNSTPNRVIKVNHAHNMVTNIELLDNALPFKGEPTNGVYNQDVGFIYIANSQWPFYDDDSNPIPDKWEPQQIRLIKLD